MHRIPSIRPLLPYLLGRNPRGIADPHFMPHLRQQVHKPMAVAGRLQPHTHRPAQLPIKSFGFSVAMHQLPFLNLSGFCIDPSDLLKTGMVITTYNDHVKAPFLPSFFVFKPRIPCRTGPSLLSNQFARQARVGALMSSPIQYSYM